MADDDNNDNNDNNDGNGREYDDDSFEGYIPQTADPGRWLLWGTLAAVMMLMLVIMPIMVYATKTQRKKEKLAVEIQMTMSGSQAPPDYDALVDKDTAQPAPSFVIMNGENVISRAIFRTKPTDKHKATCWTIFRIDKESRHLLRYTFPFTVYAVSHSVMQNVCLALVGNFIGTKHLAAYVMVILLTDLTDEFLKGAIHANTTLCAHAIGANNNLLAGRYVQLSIIFYLFAGIPVAIVWMTYTDKIILWLGWGDEMVASYAVEFAQIYIWSRLFNAVQLAFAQLLDVANKEIFTTFIGLAEEAVNMIALIIAFTHGLDVTLQSVAWLYLANSVIFLSLMLVVAIFMGWLKPFRRGIFGSFALIHGKAVYHMIRTCVPLAFGSILYNAQWAVLAVFAAHLGEAEVAAWAILGRIWQVSDSLAEGIGNASEIRVAYHLGNNHPSLAKLFAYKSMTMGMFGAVLVSGSFYGYVDKIPALFTPDETLQYMMADALPYVGVANIALAFGYICWYILGAQGKYKLGTWINFVASWGITLPLGFQFTYNLKWDLQGLSAAVVMGHVSMGACLAFCVLTTDWKRRAQKIYDRNTEDDADDEEEEKYAALGDSRTRGTGLMVGRNIKVLTAPPGVILVRLANVKHAAGCIVVQVLEESSFYGELFPGDIIIGVNGQGVENAAACDVNDLLSQNMTQDRVLTVLTPYCRDEETEEVLLTGDAPDIPDFE